MSEISQNICKIAEFKDSTFFRSECSCGADHHANTLCIEYDAEINTVSLTLYGTLVTRRFTKVETENNYVTAIVEGNYQKMAYYKAALICQEVRQRLKFTWDILTKGYIEAESQFMFKNQKAVEDYISALEQAKNKLSSKIST